jgi:hypothetical protein
MVGWNAIMQRVDEIYFSGNRIWFFSLVCGCFFPLNQLNEISILMLAHLGAAQQ